MQCLHPIINQTRSRGVETPDFGVQGLHLLLVPGVRLSGSNEDPVFDVLRDRVPHDGLQVWLLQATGVQKDRTLVTGIQFPENSGLRILSKQVPLPDREEGSLSCVGKSLIYFVAVIHHLIGISHEDGGRLVRSIE